MPGTHDTTASAEAPATEEVLDSGEDVTVLVVDDETEITSLFSLWLSEYDVVTANAGAEALDVIDADVDVVLLDRQMPNVSGDDVLERIRGDDDVASVPVAMVTATEPSVDVVKLGFDAYVVKPVTEAEIRDTVTALLERARYDDTVRELFRLSTKKALLDPVLSESERTTSREYAALKRKLERARRRADESLSAVDESASAWRFEQS